MEYSAGGVQARWCYFYTCSVQDSPEVLVSRAPQQNLDGNKLHVCSVCIALLFVPLPGGKWGAIFRLDITPMTPARSIGFWQAPRGTFYFILFSVLLLPPSPCLNPLSCLSGVRFSITLAVGPSFWAPGGLVWPGSRVRQLPRDDHQGVYGQDRAAVGQRGRSPRGMCGLVHVFACAGGSWPGFLGFFFCGGSEDVTRGIRAWGPALPSVLNSKFTQSSPAVQEAFQPQRNSTGSARSRVNSSQRHAKHVCGSAPARLVGDTGDV